MSAVTFDCPRCEQPKTDRPDRYGPCSACAVDLRAAADARFEAWKVRHAELVLRAASIPGAVAVDCVCGWSYIVELDDPHVVRCPSCGEGPPL